MSTKKPKKPEVRMGGPGKIQRVPTPKKRGDPRGEYAPQPKKGLFENRDREMEMGFIIDDDRPSKNRV